MKTWPENLSHVNDFVGRILMILLLNPMDEKRPVYRLYG